MARGFLRRGHILSDAGSERSHASMRLAIMALMAGVLLGLGACVGTTGGPSTTPAESEEAQTTGRSAATSQPSPSLAEEASPWVQVASMGVARSESQAVEVDGLIYFPGGLSRGLSPIPAHATFEVFDPGSDTWAQLEPMPAKRHHLQVAAHGGSIFVFGGLDERLWLPQDNVWRYSIEADRWQELDPMPSVLASGAAVTVDDSIYVIAGTGAAARVFRFDPLASTWTQLATLQEPREHISAAVLDGAIYVTGGRWDSEDQLRTVERYEPGRDEWTYVASIITGRAGHATVAVDGRLVVFGGEILSTRRALRSVEVYHPESDQWIEAAPLQVPTHGVAAAVVGSSVFMIGGAPTATQANATGNVYRWSPEENGF